MKKYLYLLLVVLFSKKEIFAAYPGDIIVSNAEGYVGTSITAPLPSPYLGVFDCSGLVSVCAGLRRHYTVSEMRTYFTLPRPLGWEDNLEPGDLIIRPGHVMIFVKRYIDRWGVERVDVIESRDSTHKVDHTYYKDPRYYSDSDIADCFPYYFISDISPPDIVVSGVTDNGVYNKPVVLTYSVTDDIDVYPYTEILLTRDGVTAIDKEYNKYSNEKAKPVEETRQLNRDGKYELKITAEDWRRNKSEKIVNFLIDTTPPTIKVYEQSKEFGREIPNGGVITSDKVEIVAEDLFGVSKIKVTAPSGRTYSENTTFNTRVLSGLYEYGEYTVFCEDKAGNKSDIFKFSRIRKEELVVGMGDRDITPPIIVVGNTKGEFYRYPYVRVKLENDICVIRTMDEDSGIKTIIVKGINDSYYKNILVDVSSNVWHEEHLTLGSFGKYVVVVYDKNDNKGVEEFEYFLWDDAMVETGRVLTDKLCIGLTTKFAKSKIAEISEATAFAVDTGGLYFITDSLVLTAGVYNLGTSSKFLNIAEKLPLSLSTAIFYTAKLYRHFYFRWCIDLTYIIYETLFSPIVSIGVGGLGIDIFFGYKFNVEEGSFRVGINLSLKDFEVSYVFIPTSLLDSAHRMSFGIKF